MMLKLLTVILLTLTFALGLASFVWQDLLIGAVLSTLLVLLYQRQLFPKRTPSAAFVLHIAVRIPLLLGMLLADIVRGTWQVATYVVGIRKLEHPGIVKIPLGNHSDASVGFIGHLVTISPGSFVVDFDWTDRTMLVHYIDASEPEKLREGVEKYYRLWEHEERVPESVSNGDSGNTDERGA